MKPSPYEKRIKRRITGREHSFFAVCSPGLKTTCKNEMESLGFPGKYLEITQGGVEFKGKFNSCLMFNLYLGTPSKILMRVSRFKADSFKKLEKKINEIDWQLYLPANCILKFNVTTRKSRLYHSDAIAQRCEKIIYDQLLRTDRVSMDNPPLEERNIQTIHIRTDQDNFTVSLDSTGELLFKRGIKKAVTPAPLRENLAFAMLSWTRFSKNDTLIDPMCGSGTFSLEAAMIKTGIPPGFFRPFAFEQWPGFSIKTYNHIKKQAKQNFIQSLEKQIFASDIDETSLSAVEKNISYFDFKHLIDISKKDFFSLKPPIISKSIISKNQKGVVMLNPPYGKRLGSENESIRLYRETGKKLTADFKGWRAGIIIPYMDYKSYLGLKLKLKPIHHGGLNVFAGIGVI